MPWMMTSRPPKAAVKAFLSGLTSAASFVLDVHTNITRRQAKLDRTLPKV
jgi:hypothetical protein